MRLAKVALGTEELERFYTYTAPLGTVLVTAADAEGRQNIMTVAWHSPVSMKPPIYGISVHPRRYTHDLINATGEFVVNFPPWELREQVHLCGTLSGRKADKFGLSGLRPLPSVKVRPPAIAGCYLHLECRLHEEVVLGDHSWFAGEVVAASADEELFEGGILGPRGDPVLYLGKDLYLRLGGERVQMRPRDR